MSVRVKRKSSNANPQGGEATSFPDSTTTQRETTVDGYTFHWGPNEVRNFLDDGVGAAHAAFDQEVEATITEDETPFGNPRE